MCFSSCMLCWTCGANDLWPWHEIVFLMVCPRLIIWGQILVMRCELGPVGPSYRFLASARVWKLKNFIQVDWNEQVFTWFSVRMLTSKLLQPLSPQTRWTWSACQTCQCDPRRVTEHLHIRAQPLGLSFLTSDTKPVGGRNIEIYFVGSDYKGNVNASATD